MTDIDRSNMYDRLRGKIENITRDEDEQQSAWLRILYLIERSGGSAPEGLCIVNAVGAAKDCAEQWNSHGLLPLRSKHERPKRHPGGSRDADGSPVNSGGFNEFTEPRYEPKPIGETLDELTARAKTPLQKQVVELMKEHLLLELRCIKQADSVDEQPDEAIEELTVAVMARRLGVAGHVLRRVLKKLKAYL